MSSSGQLRAVAELLFFLSGVCLLLQPGNFLSANARSHRHSTQHPSPGWQKQESGCLELRTGETVQKNKGGKFRVTGLSSAIHKCVSIYVIHFNNIALKYWYIWNYLQYATYAQWWSCALSIHHCLQPYLMPSPLAHTSHFLLFLLYILLGLHNLGKLTWKHGSSK